MTKRLLFLSISAAVLLVCVQGAPTRAMVGAGPVAVQSCTVARWQRVRTNPYWSPFGGYTYNNFSYGAPVTDGIQISYVNTSNKVADRVAFEVNYRGDIQRIVDLGTFSPNATINHTFGQFSGDAYIGPRPIRALSAPSGSQTAPRGTHQGAPAGNLHR